MLSNYHPEVDISPYLAPEETNFYQSQISILRWMVDFGRLDIYTPVALLSSYLTHPRQGHLEATYIIYQYLKSHDRSTMAFDASYVTWQDTDFPLYDWSDFYSCVTKEIPSNAPLPRGRYVQIRAFVDANHAGKKLTRPSHTRILIYLNRAPIIWYSKAQKTVESSTFGSEFVALRIATETIKALCYKLRMMGVPIEGPANALVDNDSVIKNSTVPHSTLQQKHNAICYHCVRESVAAGFLRIAHIPSDENLADMLTKILGVTKLKDFCSKSLY